MDDVDPYVEALRASMPKHSALIAEWAVEIEAGRLSADFLGDVSLRLLETLTEEDGYLDMVGAALLGTYGVERHIALIQAMRPNLRARATLRDWRLEVDRAVSSMIARRDGLCECTVDAAHGGAIWRDGYESEVDRVDHAVYATFHQVRCTRCERKWAVRQQDGYHYPIFSWGASGDH